MRFTSVRNISLGLATASFLLAGSALAQTNQQENSQNTYTLVGVNAKLDHSLSSKDARPGEIIKATLEASARTPEGVDLAKGTELCGKVDRVQPAENNSPARISLIFNRAQLKDGRTVPVHVILLSAFPPSSAIQASYGMQEMGPAPKRVPSDEKVDQKAGLLRHVAMHSDMHGQDSATFIDRKGDFTLRAGTRFQVGIAPRENAGMNSGM